MNHTFDLVPFSRSECPNITTTTVLQIHYPFLRIQFAVRGPDLVAIAFPEIHPGLPPSRKDLLWQHTCFEAFFGKRNHPNYWELNLSPSGDWNFYRLSGYRKDLEADPSIQSPPVLHAGHESRDLYRIEAKIDLSPLFAEQQITDLQIGLTAVIETQDGKKSYWALRHCGEQPDFHLRESFIDWSENWSR